MLEDLKNLFRGNNFIGQIIVINAGVFVAVNLITHLFLGGSESGILKWLGLPSLLNEFVLVPWTVLTYMFMHGGLWHIVFNMYLFYWFGRIFSDFMGEKRLIGLYFLGGIGGGLLYLFVYNLLYLGGEPAGNTILVGASAAVMAITIASGMRFPDYTVHLLLFGAVRLKYLALIIFLVSTVLDFSSNMGGKIAHLGGALVGFFYIRGLDKGKDFALSFSEGLDKVKGLFQKKPTLRVVPNAKPKESTDGTRRPAQESAKDELQAKTDAILDKISKSGYENLTKEEKAFLFKLSNKP
jgi:membrane associated rhomboid family serine protease